MVQAAIGSTQYAHIWARPETFTGGSFQRMQNFSLNLISTNAIVDFLFDEITVYNPEGRRFQFVLDSDSNPSIGLDPLDPDNVHDMQGYSINPSSYVGFGGGFCDPTANCVLASDNKLAWLVASVGYRPVQAGTTEFHLQIASSGMNHFGESTGETSVLFGTGAAPEYNAEFHRNMTLGGDTRDLVLNVGAGLPGDYNRNGKVDAGDYVVWRKMLGQMGTGLPADGSGNGVVDQADLAFWKANFGDIGGSGSSQAARSSAAVPEPGTITLIALGLVTAGRRRWAPGAGVGAL
jgi:hypothetical protein